MRERRDERFPLECTAISCGLKSEATRKSLRSRREGAVGLKRRKLRAPVVNHIDPLAAGIGAIANAAKGVRLRRAKELCH